jgi:hypothetical protein
VNIELPSLGRMPVALVEATCQCATWPQADHGRCLIVCGASVPKNYVKCHPCSKGNHTGQPCRSPRRESLFPITKTCAGCGFDLAAHREESH